VQEDGGVGCWVEGAVWEEEVVGEAVGHCALVGVG